MTAFQNQAIATVRGIKQGNSLQIDGVLVPAKRKSRARGLWDKWEDGFEADFRVWPKTTREGVLHNVTVLYTTAEKTNTFIGTVVWRDRKKVAIAIQPQKQKRFTVSLFHSKLEIQHKSIVQCSCIFENGVFTVQELKVLRKAPKKPKLKKPVEKNTAEVKQVVDAKKTAPQEKKPLTKEQQQAQELLQRARMATNPRDKMMLEGLAKKILATVGSGL